MKFALEDIVRVTGGRVQGAAVNSAARFESGVGNSVSGEISSSPDLRKSEFITGNVICSVVFDTRKLWSAETSSTSDSNLAAEFTAAPCTLPPVTLTKIGRASCRERV